MLKCQTFFGGRDVLSLRCCAGFSLTVARGSYSLIAVCRLLTAVDSLVEEHGPQVCGLQQLQLPGSRQQTQQLWHLGLVASQHVGSSQTGIKPVSPTLASGFFTPEPPGNPQNLDIWLMFKIKSDKILMVRKNTTTTGNPIYGLYKANITILLTFQ